MPAFEGSEFTELNELIREKMAESQTPGFGIGILHKGGSASAGFGVTNVENPLEVTTSTLFQIGSITKTFTGLAAAMLAEEGALDFDAPVRHYLPDFRVVDEEASAAVKVLNLFTHSAGWVGDIFRETGQGDDALRLYVESLRDVPQQFPVGKYWAYNNASFGVASRVIEVITGKPIEETLTERILKPLGMTQSFLFPRDVITYRTASGHHWGGEKGPQVARPWALARATNAVGSIASPIVDMLKYARFQLDATGNAADGTQLISADGLLSTRAVHGQAGNYATGMGIAWILREVGGKFAFGHNGGTNGQVAHMTVMPDEEFAVVGLTNGQRGNLVYDAAVAWALRTFAGAEATTPAPIAIDANKLASYAGLYKANLSHLKVEVKDSKLELTSIGLGGFPEEDSPPPPPAPPVDAVFVEEDHILVTSGLSKGARAEFLRRDDGSIEFLRMGGRMHGRA